MKSVCCYCKPLTFILVGKILREFENGGSDRLIVRVEDLAVDQGLFVYLQQFVWQTREKLCIEVFLSSHLKNDVDVNQAVNEIV